MSDLYNNSSGGTTPYIAPSFIIHENKKIKYDELGEVRAIVDIVTNEKKDYSQLKKHLVKVFAVAFAVCIVVDIIRVSVFTFNREKWKKIPILRVTTVNNLITYSKPDKMDKDFISEVTFERCSFTDSKYIGIYKQHKSICEKNGLLFSSCDEITEVLGEPVRQEEEYKPEEITDAQWTLDQAKYGADKRRFRKKYYYAYDFFGETCLIMVRYYDDIAIEIEKVIE